MAYARKGTRGTRRRTGSGRGGARGGTASRHRVRSRSSGSRSVRIELVVPGMNASRPFEVPVPPAKRSRF